MTVRMSVCDVQRVTGDVCGWYHRSVGEEGHAKKTHYPLVDASEHCLHMANSIHHVSQLQVLPPQKEHKDVAGRKHQLVNQVDALRESTLVLGLELGLLALGTVGSSNP